MPYETEGGRADFFFEKQEDGRRCDIVELFKMLARFVGDPRESDSGCRECTALKGVCESEFARKLGGCFGVFDKWSKKKSLQKYLHVSCCCAGDGALTVEVLGGLCSNLGALTLRKRFKLKPEKNKCARLRNCLFQGYKKFHKNVIIVNLRLLRAYCARVKKEWANSGCAAHACPWRDHVEKESLKLNERAAAVVRGSSRKRGRRTNERLKCVESTRAHDGTPGGVRPERNEAVGFANSQGESGGFSAVSLEEGQRERAARMIRDEYRNIGYFTLKSLGFLVKLTNMSLFHWTVEFFNFDPQTRLGRDLVELARRHDEEQREKTGTALRRAVKESFLQMNRSWIERTFQRAVPIRIEIRFPGNFPSESPVFRLVSPDFDGSERNFFESALERYIRCLPSGGASARVASRAEATRINSERMPSPREEKGLETDGAINMLEFLKHFRQEMVDRQPRVDQSSFVHGMYTIRDLWKTYVYARPLDIQRTIEETGRIILPHSTFEYIYRNNVHSPCQPFDKDAAPFVFELCNSGRCCYVGVLNFTAAEGVVVCPSWIASHLGLREGELVSVRMVSVPKAKRLVFRLLQYHDRYAELDLKTILERQMRNYTVVFKGQVITFVDDHLKYAFEVVSTESGRAVSVVDLDIEVEIKIPLKTKPTNSGQSLMSGEGQVSTTAAPINPLTAAVGRQLKAEGDAKKPSRIDLLQENVEYNQCPNCLRDIPKYAQFLHSIRCEQVNYTCERCHLVVQKRFKETHRCPSAD